MSSPLHLYIKRSSPRTLVLAPSTLTPSSKALVFRQQSAQVPHVVVVEFVPAAELELDLGRFVRWHVHVAGVLGLVGGGGSQESGGSPVKETFLVLATGTRKVGNVRPATDTSPAEPVSKLLTVSFHSLTSSTWDADPSLVDGEDFVSDSATLRSFQYDAASQAAALFPHPLAGMKKILEAGSFFYADKGSWDLSSRVEERVRRGGEGEAGVSLEEAGEQAANEDSRFVWNAYLLGGLRDFRNELEDDERAELDAWGVILPLIQGFVSTATIPLPYLSQSLTLALVSRLSCRRAGTRFNSRGVDEEGNTANFVETETVISVGDISMSWTQVRGSVPLFWEQQGLQAFGQKLQITRPAEVSQLAFEKHFDELIDIYQRVHNINLLGTKDQEVVLSTSYNDHLRVYNRSKPPPPLADMTNFDFHGAVRVGGAESVRSGIRSVAGVRAELDNFGWTLVDAAAGKGHVIEEQSGVFRTNCLDCLDRTNVVCEILSAAVAERFISSVNPAWVNLPQLWTAHSNLWADNGDLLSKVYAGTGAINTSFTRTGKRTLGGLLSDASKSVGRAYINNFTDASKQVSIDLLLGMRADQKPIEIHDPLLEKHRAIMEERSSEFRSNQSVSVHCCTWNLNGKSPAEDLLPWLLPPNAASEPDLISVAFQEIVPLTAQQIVQTDPAKRRLWERAITDALAGRPGKKFEYLLLRSEQLVGTALMVFIKGSLAGDVRKVESTTKKTGLRGMSGNKGGVAIRLDLFDTSFCFVTAHLAAGHSNVQERNSDFHTIEAGLRFLRGKTLKSHDIVLFAGDFNYRVDLPNEEARAFAAEGVIPRLLEGDQLLRAMQQGQAFGGYREAEITFLPTYKYDNGSDDYDTSEKARIPAYTDRVVYLGDSVEIESYDRAELRTSDHRPVMARFRADAQIIDKARRSVVSKEAKDSLRGTIAPDLLDSVSGGVRDLDLNGSSSTGLLPPPSSDKAQWWTEGEELADIAAGDPLGKGNPWGGATTSGVSGDTDPLSVQR